jgi:AcrR family transcriptional regulator
MARHKENERDQVLGQTRKALLAAATEAFARDGYDGANINRISLAAGFAKGTIYNYFPSKRALMLALIKEIAATHAEIILDHVEQEEEPDQRLVRFYEAGFSFVAENSAQAQLMITALYGSDPEFKQHMYQAYQPLFNFVDSSIISPGVERGIFRPLDPAATSTLLMTIYLGTSSQVREDGRPWLDPHLVADFALHGLYQKRPLSNKEG